MTVDIEDTIAAIATASGPAIRGIIRLTGPNTVSCVSNLFRTSIGQRPEQLSVQMELQNGLPLSGELLVWPSNRSYTRQPSAEFHTIGSPPLLDLALERFCESGCRLARPGEFTLRAFLGGRLDLTQAEAVLAVIDANEQTQFDIALQQLAGGLSSPLAAIREQLIDLLAELEAGLDFVEEDIEFVSNEQVIQQIQSAQTSVDRIQNQIESRSSSDSIYRVALVGWPNVGKSSLFNALISEERAIVANQAGTTRDYVSANVEKNGLEIQLIDTAGMESVAETGTENPDSILAHLAQTLEPDSIEAEAQKASLGQLKRADLRICCLDASRQMNAWETQLVEILREQGRTLFVSTKSDLGTTNFENVESIETSVHNGKTTGIETLWGQVLDQLVNQATGHQSVVQSTLNRCRDHIGQVRMGLDAALIAARDQFGDEIVAAELRHSLEQLGQIVGTVYTDDILDRIFGRFCIGK